MGLASSQARLLSITARLTSNEYESQQISNAKMRLATQSQQASEEYILALNDVQYSFISFDSTGQSDNTPLTVASLYEYADNKNQYILTNSSGKALLGNKDIKNYLSSPNLESFLDKYGLTKQFRTSVLENCWNNIFKENGLQMWANYWQQAVDKQGEPSYSQNDWAHEKASAQADYVDKLSAYKVLANKRGNGEHVTNEEFFASQYEMEQAREVFTKVVSYESAKESKLTDIILNDISSNNGQGTITLKDSNGNDVSVTYGELYKKYNDYKSEIAAYQDELDKLGMNANEAYQYDNKSKAQWYTNLWYKLNGQSTSNTGLNNFTYINAKDGLSEYIGGISDENKIASNDAKLLNSSKWISNALAKGLVNIEMSNYKDEEMTLQDRKNPFLFNLHGISWNGKIYTSISDIVETNNDKAVAKAEAVYKQRTAEINAKDEKYQRKLNLLDTEHNAIQTEYESVKAAMSKNIERSYKAFQG